MATHLAQRKGGYLAILILANTVGEAQQLQAQAVNWLRGRGLAVRFRQLTGVDAATLIQKVRTERSGVLVLSVAILPLEPLQALLDEVACPVLLVR